MSINKFTYLERAIQPKAGITLAWPIVLARFRTELELRNQRDRIKAKTSGK